MSRNQDKFNFFIPCTIEKAKDNKGDDGLVKIKGIASSAVEDADAETLFPGGFDYSYFLNKGIFNYEHNSRKDAGAIVGEPTYASVVNDGKDFYIEGYLYPNEQGKKIADQAEIFEKYSKNRRWGFSIEGSALERDMLNPKKILKARITNCAITISPKNPNTLMSIVKGGYDTPFVDDEEETDENTPDEQKSMDIPAVAPTMPESVQHAGKIKNLTKAQVYEAIIDKYGIYDENFVFINNIYNFVKSVNDKYMADSTGISQETLEKAFSILNNIEKGEKSEEVAQATPAQEAQAQPEATDIQKSENAEHVEMAKALYSGGKSKDECVEDMVRKGLSLSASQTAVESAISQINTLKENGGQIESQTSPIVKAEDVAKLVLDDISKSLQDSISKSIDPLSTDIRKGFGAVNELFKAQEQENTMLKKSLDELTARLEKMEQSPLTAKSVRNVSALEKFAKGNESAPLEGYRQVSVSDVIEKSSILNELSTNQDLAKSNEEKELWGREIRKIEIAGLQHMSPEMQRRMKIQLVA